MASDHELKMRRASKHLQDLGNEVKRWVDQDHQSVRYEYDLNARWSGPVPPGPALPQGGSYLAGSVFIPGMGPGTAPEGIEFGQGLVTAFATAEKPPRDPLGSLIGDVLFNLRSALDNLAYALLVGHTYPVPEEFIRSSEFPIFGDVDRKGTQGVGRGEFLKTRRRSSEPAPGSGLHKIRGWHPSAQTAVEILQPYYRGTDWRNDPLWVLHELNRIDKHRLIHTGVAAFEGTVWEPSNFRNVRCFGPGVIELLSGVIETDTPISRVWGVHPIDAHAVVHMEIRAALDIAFTKQTPVAAEQAVVGTLASIYEYIRGTVLPALVPYLR